jgi:hypothetical protein
MSSSSSECSYDSEEDRIQERLRSISERQRVAARAALESDMLRQWRERRRKTTQGRAYVTGGAASSGRTEATGQRSKYVEQIIEDHRVQWAEFERVQASLRGRSNAPELLYDDVPWIPEHISEEDYLVYVAKIEHGGGLRKAYAAMCLTWHPDKFQNRYFGFFKDDAEWRRVVTRVNETFARFTEIIQGAD